MIRAMPEEFYRIKRLPPYVFAEVNALKAQGRAAGQDVIDLGMGNPDGATPKHIVDKLIEAAQNPKAIRRRRAFPASGAPMPAITPGASMSSSTPSARSS
jgi:aspartate/methionine/tyrosine aminotransferase